MLGTPQACGNTVPLYTRSFPFFLLPLYCLFGFIPDCKLSRSRSVVVYDGFWLAKRASTLPNTPPPGLFPGSWNLIHPHSISVTCSRCAFPFGSAAPIWSCPHLLCFGVICDMVLNNVNSFQCKWKTGSRPTFSPGVQSKDFLKETYSWDRVGMSYSAAKISLYWRIPVGLHKLIL